MKRTMGYWVCLMTVVAGAKAMAANASAICSNEDGTIRYESVAAATELVTNYLVEGRFYEGQQFVTADSDEVLLSEIQHEGVTYLHYRLKRVIRTKDGSSSILKDGAGRNQIVDQFTCHASYPSSPSSRK